MIRENLSAQGVYVPVSHNIYQFLDRMSLKYNINYSKTVLPKSRIKITCFLDSLKKKEAILNDVEKEELNWYAGEFYNELIKSDESSIRNISARWHLVNYSDTLFSLIFNPVIGANAKYFDDEIQTKNWTGVALYGSVSNHISFQFDYKDYSEKGNKIDRGKIYTRETGRQNIGGSGNEIQYSEMKGGVNYEDKYWSISFGKDWHNWGSGYRSQLILSNKAPSFPYIKLEIQPTSWFHFVYLHGFLNSRVPDSSRFYNTQLRNPDGSYVQRVIDREKFYAAHILELSPINNLKISLGESIIYSDQGPRLEYLNPILFYRLADHYNDGGIMGRGSNSQFFGDINYIPLPGYNFYSTLFIDEINTYQIFDPKINRNQLGYTIGTFLYGIGLPRLESRIEYTRILPWVYSNSIQTQTYTNSNYLLGHYIGQNADQLYFHFSCQLGRGLYIKLWGEKIRQGGFDDVTLQYNPIAKDFLYGLRRNEDNFGVNATYEYFHDLWFEFNYQYSNITDQDVSRTSLYLLGVTNSLSVSLYYGI